MNRQPLLILSSFLLLVHPGCSNQDASSGGNDAGNLGGGTGGKGMGGRTGTGGTFTTGGTTTTSNATGGTSATSGVPGSGGTKSTGGRSGFGGSSAGATGGVTSGSGGKSIGGMTSAGGTTGIGGTKNAGGSSGTGGTPGMGGSGGSRDAGRGGADGGDSGSIALGGSGGHATGGSTGACAPPATGSKSANPLFTDQFTADPAVMVDNCTFYITCGHDQAATGQNSFMMKEWYLMKSTDMVTWTKTVVMSLSTFKWANANAWAGQMIRALHGKYYWYVPIQQSSDGTMSIGVGVADVPEGPWTDALGKPLINDAFEMTNMGFKTASDTSFTIDPTVFIDDDGQAYLQYGGFGRLTTAKLNSDMITINGKMVESSPQGYFESPYLIKRNGKYYEIYAAGSNPATIDWATATSPMGPWTYGGRILDALPRASGETDWPTNHAGVDLFAGQWYIVYHVSNGPNGGGTYRREVAVDKLNWKGDAPQKVTPSSGMSY
jgi:hypothetical protein